MDLLSNLENKKKSRNKLFFLNRITSRNEGFKVFYVGDTYDDFISASKAKVNFLYAKYGYGEVKGCDIELETFSSINEIIYFTENKLKKTPEANILDKLQLKKMCCRRHMLTHVDIE